MSQTLAFMVWPAFAILLAVWSTAFSGEIKNVTRGQLIAIPSAQIVGALIPKLLDAGALDAFTTPVFMKKNRPGVQLTVLAPNPQLDGLTELVLRESTTLGVRVYPVDRRELDRDLGRERACIRGPRAGLPRRVPALAGSRPASRDPASRRAAARAARRDCGRLPASRPGGRARLGAPPGQGRWRGRPPCGKVIRQVRSAFRARGFERMPASDGVAP